MVDSRTSVLRHPPLGPHRLRPFDPNFVIVVAEIIARVPVESTSST
jgi:hypothetical protein